MKYLLIIGFLGFVAFSCKQKPAEETQVEVKSEERSETPAEFKSIEEQILAVHDEIMPKMADINRLSAKLREIKTKAGVDENGNLVVVEGLDPILDDLRKAEQRMSDWMKNYDEMRKTLAHEHLSRFYEKELMKIEDLKQNILLVIETANEWLAAHPQ